MISGFLRLLERWRRFWSPSAELIQLGEEIVAEMSGVSFQIGRTYICRDGKSSGFIKEITADSMMVLLKFPDDPPNFPGVLTRIRLDGTVPEDWTQFDLVEVKP